MQTKRELLQEARRQGVRVSLHAFEEYVRDGVIPRPQGIRSHGLYPDETLRTLLVVPRILRMGQRLAVASTVAWGLYGAPVPEETVAGMIGTMLQHTEEETAKENSALVDRIKYRGVGRRLRVRGREKDRAVQTLVEAIIGRGDASDASRVVLDVGAGTLATSRCKSPFEKLAY